MRQQLRAAETAARVALRNGAAGLADRTNDPGRLSRLAVLCEGAAPQAAGIAENTRRSDGGWTDVEETMWCTILMQRLSPGDPPAEAGLAWIRGQRNPQGGWGRSVRDEPRIPLTSVILRFLGGVIAEPDDWIALDRLWSTDLKADLRLTYKGGFYLLCQPRHTQEGNLVQRTIDYLQSEVNVDGGFGPWQDHPIGSDPWSTGVCLVGLCRHPELADCRVISRAATWLADTQLPSGYWPYHFIDEGTAYAYWGLSEAIKFLENS